MLQEEIKLMIASIINNKKALKKLYKEGYLEYSKDKNTKGRVAVVNNKAVISILEDIYDETKVVGTVKFKNSGILIYKLFGKNYSFSVFGENPLENPCSARVYMCNRGEVIKDIAIIKKHCTRAKEQAETIKKEKLLTSVMRKNSKTPNKITEQEVFLLLKETLDKLEKSRYLGETDRDSEIEK